MIGLDSSTCVTFRYILHYLSVHSCPPEILLQIFIHLVGSRMDRIPRAMSLIHDLAAKFKVLRKYMVVIEPWDSIDILSEALSFSQLQSLVEMTHSNIRSLGYDDIFFDSWNKGYVVQYTIWNNSETRFFRITTGRVRLNWEMVASMLAA
jgi:hypothetical protein